MPCLCRDSPRPNRNRKNVASVHKKQDGRPMHALRFDPTRRIRDSRLKVSFVKPNRTSTYFQTIFQLEMTLATECCHIRWHTQSSIILVSSQTVAIIRCMFTGSSRSALVDGSSTMMSTEDRQTHCFSSLSPHAHFLGIAR